jgi:hypothetical protein
MCAVRCSWPSVYLYHRGRLDEALQLELLNLGIRMGWVGIIEIPVLYA